MVLDYYTSVLCYILMLTVSCNNSQTMRTVQATAPEWRLKSYRLVAFPVLFIFVGLSYIKKKKLVLNKVLLLFFLFIVV
jgi:hypothetical protein